MWKMTFDLQRLYRDKSVYSDKLGELLESIRSSTLRYLDIDKTTIAKTFHTILVSEYSDRNEIPKKVYTLYGCT